MHQFPHCILHTLFFYLIAKLTHGITMLLKGLYCIMNNLLNILVCSTICAISHMYTHTCIHKYATHISKLLSGTIADLSCSAVRSPQRVGE